MTAVERGTPHGWVWRDNLFPFLQTVSGLVRYRFDEWDEDAVSTGLGESSAEADRWFEYPLEGSPRLALRLALDGEEDRHVLVDVDLDDTGDELPLQIPLLLDVFSTYRMCDRCPGSF